MKKVKNIFEVARKHKKFSITILVLVILVTFGLFKNSSKATETRYVFTKTQKQDIVSAVTGSGQVSALDQVDIKSQVSGTIDYVNAKEGDTVVKGQSLAHIESADASRAVDNAELSLDNTKTAYEKAERTYKKQIGESTTGLSDLEQAIDDGYVAIANVFIDLPKIFADVSDILYNPSQSPYFNDLDVHLTGGDTAIKYKYDAGVAFDSAKKDYDTVFIEYKNLPTNPTQEQINKVITDTHILVKKLNSALNGVHNAIDYLSDREQSNTSATQIAADKNTLSSYITKTTNHVSKLSSALTDIENGNDSTMSADLSLKSAELAVNQAEDALKNAKETLFDHTITAPFDGIISKIPIENGDQISNNTTMATILTNAKKVTISLNEVDAAKIKNGNKATLTFDAINGLNINGTVNRIDVAGTINNGVVSYSVDISFDDTDSRIKAGMTANVSIEAESVPNVLAISSSAISTENGKSYVLAPINETSAKNTTDATTLKKIEIQTGFSSDDLTQVTAGLSEGQTYVSATTVSSGTSKSSGSLFNLFGRNTKSSSSSSSSSRSSSSSSQNTRQNSFGGMPPM